MDANFSRPSTAGTKDNGQRRLDTHQDVNGPLWFFNGDRCERWNFVGGLCPGINDSRASLFETPEECERSCQEPGARNGPLWSAIAGGLHAGQAETALLRQYGCIRNGRTMFEIFGPEPRRSSVHRGERTASSLWRLAKKHASAAPDHDERLSPSSSTLWE
ncbi:hypothetical protein MRX96_034995 [Rhipicephalus microplus]